MKLSCYDVADYFLTLTSPEAGDHLTNLKLQKLVYYAQGFHLAMTDQPLFPEVIEAWTQGPVVPDLYNHYKTFGSGALPLPEDFDVSKYSKKIKVVLDGVHKTLGQYSAWKLRDISYEDEVWKRNYHGNLGNQVISHDEMKVLFRDQL